MAGFEFELKPAQTLPATVRRHPMLFSRLALTSLLALITTAAGAQISVDLNQEKQDKNETRST